MYVPASKVKMTRAIQIMNALGMSPQEFADDLGCTVAIVKRWCQATVENDGYISRNSMVWRS